MSLQDFANFAKDGRLRRIEHLNAKEGGILHDDGIERNTRGLLAIVEGRAFERAAPCRRIEGISLLLGLIAVIGNGNGKIAILMDEYALQWREFVICKTP